MVRCEGTHLALYRPRYSGGQKNHLLEVTKARYSSRYSSDTVGQKGSKNQSHGSVSPRYRPPWGGTTKVPPQGQLYRDTSLGAPKAIHQPKFGVSSRASGGDL
jgi:hypothetical protein